MTALEPRILRPRETARRSRPDHDTAPRDLTEHQADPRPRSILVAEDDDEMRALLVYMLGKAGYTVAECRDGWELVTRLSSLFVPRSRGPRFDLVISDVRMPGFSGLEVLDGLATREECPPVILITAFGHPNAHEEALRLGAVAMLDKPFAIAELLRLVADTLRRPRSP